METQVIITTIFGMAVVTYLPRLLPLLILSEKDLPPAVVNWLRHIPPAVLAAMLVPALLVQEGNLVLSADNLFFWAAIPTLIAAIKSKSLFLPVLVGMVIIILARWFIV